MEKVLLFIYIIFSQLLICQTGTKRTFLKTEAMPSFANGINAIAFTENKGQICDQNYQSRPDVLFSGSSGNMVFHLKNSGISYQLSRMGGRQKKENHLPEEYPMLTATASDSFTIYRLDVSWLGAKKNAHIVKEKTIAGFNNFYLSNCPSGILNVRSYGRITYKDIYKGVDLTWYEKDGHLKYDYLVSAGADYTQIQLEIEGAESISVNQQGELVLKTPLGEIIEQRPLVKQAGKILPAKWVVKNNKISFKIEKISPVHPLEIDPAVRAWGTYYGGNGMDYGRSCTTDPLGNVFLAGDCYTNAGTVIATSGSHQSTSGGSRDAFLVKFNSAGVRQWGTYYGGSGYDYGQDCAADALGNIYLSGYTDSSTGTVIATPGSHQPTFSAGSVYDAFLVKFNNLGVRQWGTYYGGPGGEYGASCATDAFGNVYLAGTGSGTTLATAGSHQSTGNSLDAYLVKFNSAGVRQWGTYYGGSMLEYGTSCSVDALGNVYLAGLTSSSNNISTVGCHQSIYGGSNNDAFLVKFNSAGVRQWGTYYGGTLIEFESACAADSLGNVYLSGFTTSNTGTAIATLGSHQPLPGGLYNPYLVKFNTAGVRQWGTYYGGSNDSYGNCCATDFQGNVYLTGQTAETTTAAIATPGSHKTIHSSSIDFDGFLAKFNSNGIRQWGTYYGGVDGEDSRACAADLNGKVYICGRTETTNSFFIATPGSHQPANSGNNDYECFLAQFYDCTPPAPINATPAGNKVICSHSSATLTATGGTSNINWYSTPVSVAVLGTGTVYVTATLSAGTHTFYTESLGCAPSAERTGITVTVNPSPVIAVNSGTICEGGSFTIMPTGASTYSYQNGLSVLSPTSNVTYTVMGTGANGCMNVASATGSITVNPAPNISVNSGTICEGQSFTITPIGASSYTYSGGSNVISPTVNVTFMVNGTDANGCESLASSSGSVVVNAVPIITVNSGTICEGQSFTITPTGASTYTYSSGINVLTPTVTTSYSVTGTSLQGCVSLNAAISEVTVKVTPTISVNNGSICSGNSFTLSASGASTYTYSSGINVLTPTVTTSYSVTGTSLEGCVSSNTAVCQVIVSITPTLVINSGIICSGGSFTLSPVGASTYTFIGGTAVVTPTIMTSYSVTGSNADGCIATNTVVSTVSVNPLPLLNTASSNSYICAGESATLMATGTGTFSWNTNSTGATLVVSPLITTIYSVTIVDDKGCSNTTFFTQSVSECTGEDKLILNAPTLKVHPNPNTGAFIVSGTSDMLLSIVNTLGQIVKTFCLDTANNKSASVMNLSAGIYFVVARIHNTTITQKVIVSE